MQVGNHLLQTEQVVRGLERVVAADRDQRIDAMRLERREDSAELRVPLGSARSSSDLMSLPGFARDVRRMIDFSLRIPTPCRASGTPSLGPRRAAARASTLEVFVAVHEADDIDAGVQEGQGGRRDDRIGRRGGASGEEDPDATDRRSTGVALIGLTFRAVSSGLVYPPEPGDYASDWSSSTCPIARSLRYRDATSSSISRVLRASRAAATAVSTAASTASGRDAPRERLGTISSASPRSTRSAAVIRRHEATSCARPESFTRMTRTLPG